MDGKSQPVRAYFNFNSPVDAGLEFAAGRVEETLTESRQRVYAPSQIHKRQGIAPAVDMGQMRKDIADPPCQFRRAETAQYQMTGMERRYP